MRSISDGAEAVGSRTNTRLSGIMEGLRIMDKAEECSHRIKGKVKARGHNRFRDRLGNIMKFCDSMIRTSLN
jgi:hypothetical protein